MGEWVMGRGCRAYKGTKVEGDGCALLMLVLLLLF